MLYCDWCDKRFFDGELVTFRNISGTEVPYHAGCLEQWRQNEAELRRIFGETLDPVTDETFVRPFRDSQVAEMPISLPLKCPVVMHTETQ